MCIRDSSWGWTPDRTYITAHQQQGTRDPSAYLAVPAAIQYQAEHDWDEVRAQCHALIRETRQRVAALTGLDPIAPDDAGWYMQMATIPLPLQPEEWQSFKTRLYDQYRVEAPIICWGGKVYIRISAQGYNTREDMDRLVSALSEMLKVEAR